LENRSAMNTITPVFGDLTLEEKRAAIKHLLGGSEDATSNRSTGVFNPTRTELLKAFRLDEPFVRGVGHQLYDASGREFLDFLSQYGAVSLGHNHPELWQACMEAQQEQLPTMIQPTLPVAARELSDKLAEITPGDLNVCVFTNSGAEAVEAAIKLARARTGRPIILSTTNGFHGKTLGALSATGRSLYQKPFGAPVEYFERIPYGDLGALKDRLAQSQEDIAAFIIEPIQGEGGVITPPSGYLTEAIKLCRHYGVLTILDEIQTGLGRTGSMFGLPENTETPDILTLAKTLSGGLIPIGACITTPEIWDDEFGQLHSSTFANNNLACRVATRVIEILQRDNLRIIKNVATHGEYLAHRLNELKTTYPDIIKAVRGRGYMAGLEFYPFMTGDGSGSMAFFSMNEGLMAVFSSYLFNAHRIVTAPAFNSSHTLRLQPPYTVGPAEIDRVISALDCLCDALDRGDYHHIIQILVGKTHVTKGGKHYKKPKQRQPVSSHDDNKDHPGSQFTFVIHYMHEQDFVDADPSFEQFTSKEMERLRKWSREVGPGFVHHIEGVQSKAGCVSDGWLMFLPMIPRDMVHIGRKEMLEMLEKAKHMAARRGSSIVGLGGFTSIVSQGGDALTGQGAWVTSGNTLTSVMAVTGIEDITKRVGMDLSQASVAVVGATGAIGRLVSLMIADRIGSLTLVGNASNTDAMERCQGIADEIYASLLADNDPSDKEPNGLLARTLIRDVAAAMNDAGNGSIAAAVRRVYKDLPIHCTTNLDAALGNVDIVIAATNSDTAIIQAHHLRDWSIVCDVARPPNVSDDAGQASKALVFDGGLVELPNPVEFGVMGLPPGVCWGCLGETILLALESAQGDHSIGQILTPEEAAYITDLAKKHGFKAALPHRFDKLIPEENLDEFAQGYAQWQNGG
jgi:acetylornithine/succinyldiaminopimelate/putrescine aminotransferase/predicted amino acid dehydrogenase